MLGTQNMHPRSTMVASNDNNVEKLLWHLHNAFLDVTFFVIMPIAIGQMYIRHSSKMAWHVPLQSISSVLITISMIINIVQSQPDQPPVIFETILGSLVLVQVACGVATAILKRLRMSGLPYMAMVHRWIGRLLLPMGWITIGLNIWYHGSQAFLGLILVGTLESLLLIWLYTRHRRSMKPKDNDGQPRRFRRPRPRGDDTFQLTADDDYEEDDREEDTGSFSDQTVTPHDAKP